MAKELFRKAALERLASPEQIDRLLVIVGVRGWLSLLFIILIILSILAWSVMGEISITANGVGLFFNPDNIAIVRSNVEGIVDEINVQGGDTVKKGEELLVLHNPALLATHKEFIAHLKLLEKSLDFEKRKSNEALSIRLKLNHSLLEFQKMKLRILEETIQSKAQDPLPLYQLKTDLYDAKIAVEKQESEIALLEQEIENPNYPPFIEDREWELLTLKENIKALSDTMENLHVYSPMDGTILLVNPIMGEEVQSGATLMWLESTCEEGEENLVYGFFPVDQGELIKVGMKVQIQLASVDPEKYGKMIGKVKLILPYAATGESQILKSIPSVQLRDFLALQSNSLLVEIEPEPDPFTVSQYKWTTKQGPPFAIHPGSIASVSVVVDRKKPISYLLPLETTKKPAHE